jgi:hypothetical protein
MSTQLIESGPDRERPGDKLPAIEVGSTMMLKIKQCVGVTCLCVSKVLCRRNGH